MMTSIVSYVLANYNTPDEEFVEHLSFSSDSINTFSDFLEFLAWWACRDDFRLNILKDSWFGVVQQYRGLLTQEESDYVDERSAGWIGGEYQLRHVLNDVRDRFA